MHVASAASSQGLNANYLVAIVLRLEKPGGVRGILSEPLHRHNVRLWNNRGVLCPLSPEKAMQQQCCHKQSMIAVHARIHHCMQAGYMCKAVLLLFGCCVVMIAHRPNLATMFYLLISFI